MMRQRAARVGSRLAGFLLVVVMGVLTAGEAGWDPQAELPADPKIRMGRLPNGFRYWIRRHQTPPNRLGLWLRVNTGSLNEEENQRGLAHFLEHLAFEGSQNFPSGTLVKYFESLGMIFGEHQNASTSFDQTLYLLNLPDAREATLSQALVCLADYAWRLSLTEEAIEQERPVILEEMRLRQGPNQRLLEKILPVLAPGSRLADRLPIGLEERVANLKRPDFQEYYRKWYRPDNSLLLIAGDADPEEVARLVERHFGEWPAAEKPAPNLGPGVQPYTDVQAAVLSDPEHTSGEISCLALYPLRPIRTAGDFRLSLLDDLGTWILDRRLEELQQKGQAPYQRSDCAIFRFWNACMLHQARLQGEPGRWAEMTRVLTVELKRAREHGFLAREMEDARREFLASAEEAAEKEETWDYRSFLARMNSAASQERQPLNEAHRLELLRQILPGLTLDELNATFRKNFAPERRLFLLELPERDGVARPEKAQVLECVRQAEGESVAPHLVQERPQRLLEREPGLGEIKEQTEEPELRIASYRFTNGARVHLREMDYEKNQVYVRLTLGGGILREAAGQRGLTDIAVLLFRQPATARFNSTLIRDLMTGRKVALSAELGEDVLRLILTGTPAELEHGLQLVYLLLTEGRIEESILKNWREDILRVIEARRHSVEQQRGEAALALLSNNDPRLKIFTPEQARALRLEEGQAWLENLCRTAPLEVSIVGDLPREKALALALKYIGSLPPRPERDPELDKLREFKVVPGPLSARVEVETITPRAAMLVGWRGVDFRSVRDRRGLQLAALILDTRLRQEIRERQGLTYSINCLSRPSKAYPQGGLFAVLLNADPRRAEEAMGKVRALCEAFAREGPTDEELATVRKQLQNVIESSQKQTAYWSDLLADLDYHGTRLADVKEVLPRVLAFTAEDIREIVAQYLRDERRLEVMALPRSRETAPQASPQP